MTSVGNDPIWLPIVTLTTKRCYADFFDFSDEYYCDEIPKYLYDVVDCTYIENFLRCPLFNPKRLNQCLMTFQYVDECLRTTGPADLINIVLWEFGDISDILQFICDNIHLHFVGYKSTSN